MTVTVLTIFPALDTRPTSCIGGMLGKEREGKRGTSGVCANLGASWPDPVRTCSATMWIVHGPFDLKDETSSERSM